MNNALLSSIGDTLMSCINEVDIGLPADQLLGYAYPPQPIHDALRCARATAVITVAK